MKLQSALCNTISMQEAELSAANKAIVALSEALDRMHDYLNSRGIVHHRNMDNSEYIKATLATHAPAIEKARGG